MSKLQCTTCKLIMSDTVKGNRCPKCGAPRSKIIKLHHNSKIKWG